ncbi:outer membrane protein assembly factor BamB family protein [Tahibacter harae]|uniref:PQQ-binding-like beta-propeller repeat protein n=1 Tax=Tahibacter harae TaxID=2963937 RepID=A0ABT1QV48_9GAMM|nr:PQQ-binding-like beta-propeller repeat protein [Tahibacter harae]MCQ4166157.1 PQQ-binding-like beta-propeller repeat protein [Tahibacter harae]
MHAIKRHLHQWLLFLFVMTCAVGAGAGWQRDWNETGPAFSLRAEDGFQLAGTADGSALVGSTDGYDYRLSQVSGDGSIAWSFALPLSEWTPADFAPEPDGATLLMFTGLNYASVARLDASGALQWSSALQGHYFAIGGDRLVARTKYSDGAAVVTAIDRLSGQWLWQVRVPGIHGHWPARRPIAVDSDGNTYLVGPGDDAQPLLAKLNPQGGLAWLRPVASLGVIAVRDGRIYLPYSGALQVLDAAGGQQLWRNEDCDTGYSELFFIAGDPLCVSAGELARVSAVSGTEVWRREYAGAVLGVFGDDVYIGSDPTTFPVANGVLARLAGSDGEPLWQQPMPFPVLGRIWQVSADLIAIAGPGRTDGSLALRRYRIPDGSLSDDRPLADVPRGVQQPREFRDGSDLFVLAGVPWKALPTRVRRLAADSGDVLWENAAPPRQSPSGVALTPDRLLLAEETDMGDALVRSLDRANGQQRWERSIVQAPVSSGSMKPPRIIGLPNNDALVSYGYRNNLYSPTRVQELQRLSDASGQTLWIQQLASWNSPSVGNYWAEPFLLGIGEDALLWPARSIEGPIGLSAQRRSGVDGALMFSSAAAPLASMVRLSVAADAVFALGFADRDTLRLTKHSATSGELLWQFDYPTAPWPDAALLDLLPLADGDVMMLVQFYNSMAAATGQTTHLLRIKSDGSGLRYVYRTPMQGKTRDLITRIVLAGNGEALLRRLLHQDRRSIEFLQRFDLEQVRVLGSQALQLRGVEPFAARSEWNGSFVPHADGILISGTVLQSPLPPTRRDALLDIGIVQHGDLGLQVPAFPAGINEGDSVPFTVGVSYTGDAAVTDATLIVELPWQGGESGLSCTGAGISRCDLLLRHGQLTARFDAAPGAQLELRGTLRRLAAPALDKSVLRAVVHAPIGLLEGNIYNNFRNIPVDGPIFADDFDQ